jgi:MOSC domain-containing protein YiiM
MAHVEHIHIAPYESAPVQSVGEVEAVKGVGLIGDRNANHTGVWSDEDAGREVTLVEAESLEMLARDHGIELAPGGTRRNLTTRDVRLNDLVGKTFRVGEVVMTGVKLCEPCEHLQGMVGRPIIKPLTHKAGLRAMLVNSGVIRVGDAVELVAQEATTGAA